MEDSGYISTAFARERLAEAEAAVKVAERAFTEAKNHLRFCKLRLFPCTSGIPDWVLALAAATVAAVVLAAPGLLVGSLVWIVAMIVVSYSVGTVLVLKFFGDTPEENDATRASVRMANLEAATARLNRTEANFGREIEDAEKRRAFLNAIHAANASKAIARQREMASHAAVRQREMDRLLMIDPGRLYPDELEAYVGEVFAFLGYAIKPTGQSGDQGVDILAERPGMRLAIQVKRYQGSVGNSAVQEVFAGKAHYNCHRCIVITSADAFTSGAISLAQSTDCMLIARSEIAALIRGEIAF